MTREHKLALIFGFALVLVVGLLISDNFSASRKSEPGGPAVAESQPPMFKEEVLVAGGNTAKPTISMPSPSITDPVSGAGAPLGEPVVPGNTFVMGTNQPGGNFTERLGNAWEESIEGIRNGHISTPEAAQLEAHSTLTPPTGAASGPQAGLQTPTGNPPFVTPAPSPVPVDGNGLTGPGRNTEALGGKPEAKPLEPHEAAPTTAAEAASKDKAHQIVDGDSFWKIAKRHYNDGSLADALKAYNKSRIGKNGQLRVGASLLIPEKSLLKGGATARKTATVEAKPEKKSDLKVPNKENLEKIAANKRPEAKAESTKQSGATTYVVQSGDTLGKIAKKLLGSSARASEILDANSSLLDNEDDVQAGQKLKVPAR